MIEEWSNRNTIVSNLLNPALCGSIIQAASNAYYKKSKNRLPFLFSFLILPIVLHKDTRERFPRTTRTYLFSWVEENDDLFYDFCSRTKSMVKYTREALMFLLLYKAIEIESDGTIKDLGFKFKQNKQIDYDEYNDIIKKSIMLGKWLILTPDVKSLFSFFRITP